METQPLYTIGYGMRSIEEFLVALQKYGIKYLIDVRSKPYSRIKPEFSKQALDKALQSVGIRYVYMGDQLGGTPEDTACYHNGKADYSTIEEKAFYRDGIDRLRTAYQKHLAVCLMCSEQKPEHCHRSKLIGRTLLRQGIPVVHINERGALNPQESVMTKLEKGQLTLFETPLSSRKRYNDGTAQ